MSEDNIKMNERPEELNRAEKFIDEGKYDNTLEILRDFKKKRDQNPHDVVSCHLLECKLLFQQSSYEKTVELAEKTYKESLGLGINILSVDALNIMAHALLIIFQLEKAFKIINQAEELLKSLKLESPTVYKQREANIAYLKGYGYRYMDNFELALENFEHSLSLREELGIKHELAASYSEISLLNFHKGDLKNAIKYAEQALAFAKQSNKKLYIADCLRRLTVFYKFSGGDRTQVIMLENQTSALYKEINNKFGMAILLSSLGDDYRLHGNLDKALECLEHSLASFSEIGNLRYKLSVLDSLIQVLIEKNDLMKAQQCLSQLKHLKTQMELSKFANLIYLYDKALILKSSPRTRNRGKAEELFKKIIESGIFYAEITIGALFNLCELLLIELRLTNELEVLDELNQFITKLLDITEHYESFRIFCEVYLLKAKISLVSYEVKKAQRFLTQARQIAERHEITDLKSKISSEFEDLQKKLDLWEKLKKSGASMADRFDLAHLDEQIRGMVQSRRLLTSQLIETKVVIHKEKKICLVCRGEVLRFSYICECGSIYCENCARALTNLENVCWSCEAPIDYLKPVKPSKEEAEEINIDIKGKN
ncbi:MAG: tetratricopeptide repeat protein [Candidatus Thorarchaeota archaeon]